MGAAAPFFLGVLGLGAVLRVITMLGYRPALWFPDSYTYVVTALKPRPDLVRPAGYPMFLRLFEPFHSFALVTLVQHLLGLMVGVLVYLTARRLRAPGWAAVGASVPSLLDAYQIELEHLLVSDTLFAVLIMSAVCLGVRRTVGWRTACGIGLLLAAATLTRTVGLPLVVIFAAWLIYRERGRVVTPRLLLLAGVMLIAATLPILGYGAWFYATYQRVGIVGANGVFLYAKTMTFADCAVMKPSPDLAVLCDPGRRASGLPCRSTSGVRTRHWSSCPASPSPRRPTRWPGGSPRWPSRASRSTIWGRSSRSWPARSPGAARSTRTGRSTTTTSSRTGRGPTGPLSGHGGRRVRPALRAGLDHRSGRRTLRGLDAYLPGRGPAPRNGGTGDPAHPSGGGGRPAVPPGVHGVGAAVDDGDGAAGDASGGRAVRLPLRSARRTRSVPGCGIGCG
ncbi:ArnT family glycosyltransferase [Streptosporangium lutulentum]